MKFVLTPELILQAYRQGLFPMAYSGESKHIQWVCPEERGQLSIEEIHIPKSLRKIIRKNLKSYKPAYEIRINTAFKDVILACGEATDERPQTWINDEIIDLYCALHEQGHAHSVEYWHKADDDQEPSLMGGLYGLAIGGAFFGESMYSRYPNASKIALIHLVARLYKLGYSVLDTQFVNDHLLQFGVYELGHDDYMKRLYKALQLKAQPFASLSSIKEENKIMKDYLAMRKEQAVP